MITDEFHVYKCIRTGRDSNGDTVVASTVKPTGTSATLLVETADTGGTGRGYIWKYMYTVSYADTIKFVTTDFIPVKTIGQQTELGGTADDGTSQWDVENNAIDGGILHVKVTNGGAGYTHYASGYTIAGDGSSGGVCTVHVKSDGTISHITVTNNGTGYEESIY